MSRQGITLIFLCELDRLQREYLEMREREEKERERIYFANYYLGFNQYLGEGYYIIFLQSCIDNSLYYLHVEILYLLAQYFLFVLINLYTYLTFFFLSTERTLCTLITRQEAT